MSDKKFAVTCAGCKNDRMVRPSDWRTRKSDYCETCSRRARVGLQPCDDVSGKGTRLYNIWRGMRQRCGYIAGGHAHDVKHYADRGITVCEDWRGRFTSFKAWADANGYAESLLLDRIDNDLGYSPDNCRWVQILTSNRNKRSVVQSADRVAIRDAISNGVKQCVLARLYGVSDATVSLIKREAVWTTP